MKTTPQESHGIFWAQQPLQVRLPAAVAMRKFLTDKLNERAVQEGVFVGNNRYTQCQDSGYSHSLLLKCGSLADTSREVAGYLKKNQPVRQAKMRISSLLDPY